MKKSMCALLLSGVPWAFLALYGDAVYGWAWPYLMPFVSKAAAALLWKERGKSLLAGNLLSLGLSMLVCILLGFTEQASYFKPFGALGWVAVLTLASGLVQWLVWKREWTLLGLLTAIVTLFLGSAYWLQFQM